MRALIATLGEHGHVNPILAVVRSLVASGADVAVAVPGEFRAPVEAAGAVCLPFTSIFAASRRPLGKSGDHIVDFPSRVVGESRHVLPQLLPVATAWRPDLVAYDKMLLAGGYVARRLGVPAAVLCPTYAENDVFSVARARSLPLGSSPAFQRESAAFAVDWGGPELTPEAIFHRSEALNIVFVLEQLQPRREAFDERYEFVGPSLTGLIGTDTGTVERQTIYVSLGTIFHGWQELFHVAAQALGGTRWPVVMATGRDAAVELASNVTQMAHAPQLEVLRRSRVFVTHGGMNSVMEALTLGVPMLVIPQMPEQEVTAARIVELGLGLAMSKSEVNPADFLKAVESLASDGPVRARVESMQRLARASGGATRAAALLTRHAIRSNAVTSC